MNADNSRYLLRASKDHADSKVVYAELFFDLVFVFAITQVSHFFLHHLDWAGLAKTIFLTLAVWWVWIYTAWVTNYLDPQRTAVRLMLFSLMLAGLVLAVSMPLAFGARSISFAWAYVSMQVGRSLFMIWALRHAGESNRRNFLRVTVWLMLSGLFWIFGAYSDLALRYPLWCVALMIEYISPAAGFWLPALGRSTTADWDISGSHLAERCGLLMIIALGEGLLVSGATFEKLDWSSPNVMAFLIAFLGTLTMWWIYFNVGAECAAKRVESSDDPGHLGRLAYSYFHIIIVIGVILVDVSDELVLAHPIGAISGLTALVMLVGPALFVLGNLLFKKVVFGRYALSHILGIGLLLALLVVYPFCSRLYLAGAATVVMLLVAIWESYVIQWKLGQNCL